MKWIIIPIILTSFNTVPEKVGKSSELIIKHNQIEYISKIKDNCQIITKDGDIYKTKWSCELLIYELNSL